MPYPVLLQNSVKPQYTVVVDWRDLSRDYYDSLKNMGEFLHFRGLGKLMKEGKYQTQLQFMIPSPSNKYALMKLPSPKAYAF